MAKLVAVAYSRVSTGRQAKEGVSLAAQKVRLKAWAKSKGRRLVAVHTDTVSGRETRNRPALEKAIDEVCRTQGVLVVYSLSRLARSTADALKIAKRLEECGANLASLSESIDTTSAMGKFVYRLMASLAELESDTIGERVRLSVEHRRSKGVQHVSGPAPYGYRVKEGRLVPLPEEQKVVARARKLAPTHSLRAIARILHSEGLTDHVLHPESVNRLLR